MNPAIDNYARESWVLWGRQIAACRRSLEVALDAAPRAIERDWIREGYDAFLADQQRLAA